MKALSLLFLASGLFVAGCDSAPASDTEAEPGQTESAQETLDAVAMEQGIGPIRDLDLGELDPALVAQGEEQYTLKCSACHKLGERYVGPPLGDVLARRRPEFVMNMMLNANEMVERHPTVRELLAEYYTPMPVQAKDEAEARAILEYLRSVQQ